MLGLSHQCRSCCNAKPPVPNISKEEKLALDKLRKDTSIQILPADKGRATVIMDKDDYETRVKDMLEDEKTYGKLNRDDGSYQLSHIYDNLFAPNLSGKRRLVRPFRRRLQLKLKRQH